MLVEILEVFNSYVKPPTSAIWSTHATQIHGLHKNHPSILHTDRIELVWDRFCKYLTDCVPIGKISVLVAWNGDSCDME